MADSVCDWDGNGDEIASERENMKISASNTDGEIKASFDFAKEEAENRQDFIYNLSTMLACAVGEITDQLEPYHIEGRKDCAASLLEAVKLMVSEYYDDLAEKTTPEEKQRLAEAGMYAFMEEQYSAFLKENNLDEKDLLDRVRGQNPDLRVSKRDGAYHFELNADDGSHLLDVGSVSANADQRDIGTQAMIAGVVAIVLLDRAFGKDDSRNVAREKGSIKFFLDMM